MRSTSVRLFLVSMHRPSPLPSSHDSRFELRTSSARTRTARVTHDVVNAGLPTICASGLPPWLWLLSDVAPAVFARRVCASSHRFHPLSDITTGDGRAGSQARARASVLMWPTGFDGRCRCKMRWYLTGITTRCVSADDVCISVSEPFRLIYAIGVR